MADSKVTDLSTVSSLDVTDIFYVVGDVSGTPVSRKVPVLTVSDLVLAQSGNIIPYATLAAAAASITSSDVGNTVITREHTATFGYEGGNNYLVQSGTITDNGGSLIQGTVDTSVYLEALSNEDPINVLKYGCAGNNSTDNTTAVDNVLTIEQEVKFGVGTFLLDEVEVDVVGSRIIITGAGIGKTVISPKTSSTITHLLRFRNILSLQVRDITFDGLSKCDYGVHILDAIAGDRDIYFENVEFKDFVSATTQAGGFFGQTAWKSAVFKNCRFDTLIGNSGAGGIILTADISYGGEYTYVTGCDFCNIINSNSNTDADGIRVVCNTVEPTNIVVHIIANEFSDCETRSVKTQARHTNVIGNHFSNRANTGRTQSTEVDIQRGSSTIDSNTWEYVNATVIPGVMASVRAFENFTFSDPTQHVISNNKIKMDSGTIPVVFAVHAQLGGTVQSFIISNNIVSNVVEKFVSITTTKTNTAIRMNGTISNNDIWGVDDGFVFLTKDVDDPDDVGTNGFFNIDFIGNINRDNGSTTRQVQAHPTASLGDNLTVFCELNHGNMRLDPTITDDQGNLSLNQVWRTVSNGNILINKYSDNATTQGLRYIKGVNETTLEMVSGTTGSSDHIQFLDTTNGVVGSITTSAATTAYNTTSDIRVKENIKPIGGAMDLLSLINAVYYNRIGVDHIEAGFIAQELHKIIPGAVTVGSDEMIDGKLINPWQIDMSKLMPYVVAAIIDLSKRK